MSINARETSDKNKHDQLMSPNKNKTGLDLLQWTDRLECCLGT